MSGKKTKIGLSAIVENSPHIIFYTDAQGNLNYVNPAGAATTGYTEKEIKEGGFKLLFDEETLKKIYSEYIPVTIKEGITRREVDLICKDGSKRYLNVTSFVMKNGIVAGIAVDLTEIRKLEIKLREEKEKAEKANRAKSEFLSNMSHEMRTPMNAIIGMTDIARNTLDKSHRIYALNKVEEASKHLLGIINDVLDMSKIEANKFDLSIVQFELRPLLHKVVSFVRYAMDDKKHKFTMNIDENIPDYYYGDDQRLAQVITNLLSNAVKFTPDEGKISLAVSLTEGARCGSCSHSGISELCFEVSDTGIGIPYDKQKNIFDMFEQGDKGTTRKYGGTGLGLSISKHIVNLMGGEISVSSEPGAGSKFVFTVKLLEVKKDESLGELEEIDTCANCNEYSGKSILLAEDIEINREILMYILEETGIKVDVAENGQQAYEKYGKSPFSYDLIFMDVQMPVMDGIEATKLIRKYEKNELPQSLTRIPVIAMTANVFKEDIDACLAAGMDDHIGKPLDKGMVYEKLHKYLHLPRMPSRTSKIHTARPLPA